MMKLVATCALLLLSIRPTAGQTRTGPADDLSSKIAALDRAVFDAYNSCDLEHFGQFFAEDVEFYDDREGLSRSRASLINDVRTYICGKVRRELVPGTLEVHPIGNYGALEIGVHRFHHPGHDATEPVGEARFLHIWQNNAGTWKITRVISYGHRPAPR
jgi:ketosteroid isomerase-like protein